MKILAITSRFPYSAGESFLIPELLELRRLGHDVTIVPVRTRGGLVHGDVATLLPHVRGHALWAPRVLADAARMIPATVGAIAHLLPTLMSGASRARYSNLAALPKALHVARLAERSKVTHIHAYWATPPATVAMIAAELTGIPWSFTAHRGDIVANNLLVEKLERAVAARVISRSGRELIGTMLSQRGIPAARIAGLLGKTHIIHLGIDVPPTPAVEPRHEVVLCSASFYPVKGHTVLLTAFRDVAAQRPAARLVLAGDGPLRATLENQAKRDGIADRVEFLGYVPHDELLRRYRDGDVRCLVLPSVTLGPGEHEGIPVSLMEAMSYGIPVVATTSGGIPELVTPSCGVLVPERDPAALAAAIISVLRPSETWPTLAAAGRRRIEEDFNVARTAAQVVALMGQEASCPPAVAVD